MHGLAPCKRAQRTVSSPATVSFFLALKWVPQPNVEMNIPDHITATKYHEPVSSIALAIVHRGGLDTRTGGRLLTRPFSV